MSNPSITVGDIEITQQRDQQTQELTKSYWLQVISGPREGEGMQTSESVLYKAISDLYNREF